MILSKRKLKQSQNSRSIENNACEKKDDPLNECFQEIKHLEEVIQAERYPKLVDLTDEYIFCFVLSI